MTWRRIAAAAAILALLAIAAGLVQYFRPLPQVAPAVLLASRVQVPGAPPAIPWPAAGAAAVSAGDLGMIGSHGETRPVPIWSMTKVITAAVVLADHPLLQGQDGPTVTVSASDVAEYESLRAQEASVVAVAEGERLTERQMLEAMLVPSGNNIANLLARWDAGSEAAFVQKMNDLATTLGMTSTHAADPAGFSDQSVSVPADLVRVGRRLMADPVFAHIVAETETTLPVAGRVFNVDYILGRHGIVGIKTGSSPGVSAGFLFDSRTSVGGEVTDVIGAVLDQPSLPDAFTAAEAIVDAVRPALTQLTLMTQGAPVARYQPPWGGVVAVLAPKTVTLLAWPGAVATLSARMPILDAPSPAGTPAGSLSIRLGDQAQDLQLDTSGPLLEPGKRWRLTRGL